MDLIIRRARLRGREEPGDVGVEAGRIAVIAPGVGEKAAVEIDAHCDETGDDQSRFIEVLAKLAIERGFQGRVAASHATAMHNYNNDYAFKLIGILKRAGVNVITNPF